MRYHLIYMRAKIRAKVKNILPWEVDYVKIGYARVSTKWYQGELQIAELEKLGCDKVWSDTLTGGENSENQLKAFIKQLSSGDTVIATRVTSVAQSAAELLHLLEEIDKKGAYFKSLAEPWANTNEHGGERVIETIRGMIGFELALAALDKKQDVERPQTFGISLGRPRKLSEKQKYEAMSLLKIGRTAAEISRKLGVSRSTISRLKRVIS